MLEWEWYDDIPTKVLFFHLLLTVNYEDKKWRGQSIKKGSIITSLGHLAEQTHLSVRNVRTALDKLEKTGEVTRRATNRFTQITLVNWSKYQTREVKATSQKATKRQSKDKQTTTTKEGKNIRKKEIHIAATSAAGVNQIFEKFQMLINPTINYGNKTQRKAADELIKKMGLEQTIKLIEYCAQIKNEKFAPTVTTPYQLKEKLAQVSAYWNKNNNQSPNVASI